MMIIEFIIVCAIAGSPGLNFMITFDVLTFLGIPLKQEERLEVDGQ